MPFLHVIFLALNMGAAFIGVTFLVLKGTLDPLPVGVTLLVLGAYNVVLYCFYRSK